MVRRERMLGRQAIVHRQHADTGIEGKAAAMAVMGVEVADDEAAAVEVDEARRHRRSACRRIEPARHIARPTRNLHVQSSDVLGRAGVLRGPLHSVACAHHLGRQQVQRRHLLAFHGLGLSLEHGLEVGIDDGHRLTLK
jgi:hypothetical protein